MSGQSNYKDLLYAYSLGCLDNDDLIKLKDYLKEEGEFPWDELGEYQNLIALFPTILEIEKPEPELKDKVARKLYRLRTDKPPLKAKEKQEESIDKVSEEHLETHEEISEPTPVITTPERLIDKISGSLDKEDTEINHSDFEEVRPQKQLNDILPGIPDVKIDGEPSDFSKRNNENLSGSTERSFSSGNRINEPVMNKTSGFNRVDADKNKSSDGRRSNTWIIITSVFFILIAAGLFLLYMNISSEVKQYKNGIDNLNKKIQSLSSKVNENRDIQKILQTKDIEIINLKGTDISPESFGKLIIGTLNRNSLLQLSGLPLLSGNEVYQLWMNNNGNYISIGFFNPKKDVDYFHFTLPELPVSAETSFILTEEPSEGAGKPGKIYLSNAVK